MFFLISYYAFPAVVHREVGRLLGMVLSFYLLLFSLSLGLGLSINLSSIGFLYCIYLNVRGITRRDILLHTVCLTLLCNA